MKQRRKYHIPGLPDAYPVFTAEPEMDLYLKGRSTPVTMLRFGSLDDLGQLIATMEQAQRMLGYYADSDGALS